MMDGSSGAPSPVLAHLARFVAEGPLLADKATIAILRDGVIDTLGCIHAGVGTDVARKARAGVAAMGGGGPGRVIGSEMHTSRPQAAFLNAVAGHALDFDDWETPGNTHPTVVLFPAIIAVCDEETTGANVSQAYLAGFEVIARLGEALNFEHYDAGWHSTATLGTIGAAAAVGRLLGLPAEAMTNALSIASSIAAGYTCQFGSDAKALQAGFAARGGVEAALLAAAGLTGQPHVLSHPRGLGILMAGASGNRLRGIRNRLGGGLALSEHGLVLKPWPSCGYTHRIMTAAIEMRDAVDPTDIDRIDIHLPDFHAQVLPYGKPTSRVEALFSLPFVAAMGLSRGGLKLNDMAQEAWTAPEIVALAEMTSVHPYKPARPDLNYALEDPDRLVLTLRDGRSLEQRCVYPTGAPQATMPAKLLWQKFADNVGHVPETWAERLKHWPAEHNVVNLFLGAARTS